MISVVLPIYRVEKYIKACITSVLGQSYRDFEVVLVDDGSPDRSAEIAETLLRKDGTVPYQIVHTINRGVSAARNTGLDVARGEYVVMVDSDDVLSPYFLQGFSDMMKQKPNLNIYSCGFSVVDENNCQTFASKTHGRSAFDWDEAQRIFFDRKVRFLLPALMFSKRFLQENAIRFDEDVRYSEDVQFIWRCLAHNRKVVFYSENALYNYILHPGSTMTASSVSKILTCCTGIEQLHGQVGTLLVPEIRERLVSVTWFSMLHGAAKMMSLHDFLHLYEAAESISYMRAAARDESKKVRMVAKLLLLYKPFGYWIMRKF